MALEPINLTEKATIELIEKIGSIGHWLQAIGAILVIWVIFQVASFIIERKRLKTLKEIALRLEKIEKKLNKHF
jgi:hypothetical protein